VDKIIKKHSSKKTNKTTAINPVSHNKSSNLVIIEEKEEDGFSKKNIKKSVPKKNFDSKRIINSTFNKKTLMKQTKNSIPKQQSSKPVTPVDLFDKKPNYDFLQGFKDKMKNFLKNKNKKDTERSPKTNIQNNFLSPLINYRKNYQKSLSKTPVSKLANVRSIDSSSNKTASKIPNKSLKLSNNNRKVNTSLLRWIVMVYLISIRLIRLLTKKGLEN
jgi:hypothetical protein